MQVHVRRWVNPNPHSYRGHKSEGCVIDLGEGVIQASRLFIFFLSGIWNEGVHPVWMIERSDGC